MRLRCCGLFDRKIGSYGILLLVMLLAMTISSTWIYLNHARNSTDSSLLNSPCGDWIPYKNEACVKLIDDAGTQTKEDAETVCKALSQLMDSDNVPKLITVKTKQKQEFLKELLFSNEAILDNVWIGLELGNNGKFRWNDGMDLLYANWAENEKEPSNRGCVQMVYGDPYQTGTWVKVGCKKRNAVVCERTQSTSINGLQNVLESLKLEVESNKQELEYKMKAIENEAQRKIKEVKEKAEELIKANGEKYEQKLDAVRQKAEKAANDAKNQKVSVVPIGFIYIQFASQDEPAKIWPETKWQNVSEAYGGLFLRVKGGNSAPFGQIQEEKVPRLKVESQPADKIEAQKIMHVPDNGEWSGFTSTGALNGDSGVRLRFQSSKGEFRPRNMAIVIWKRIA